MVNNQDPHSQVENHETAGTEYPNECDSEQGQTSKSSAFSDFMPQILPDDGIAKSINSLNSKHREVLEVVHT